MQSFIPQKILMEASVANLPLSQRVVKKFPLVPLEVISDYSSWKEPGPISPAKRFLVLAENRGEALKPFPKIKHAINLGDYVFNPISNCHLECTYCILQSYLKNNPVLTLFANLDHFLQEILKTVQKAPKKTFRLGTGELSDSLALDEITDLSTDLVPFFSKLPNAFLELKTKSNAIHNLLNLKHQGHTVVSWSISPNEIVQKEELKCASLEQRLCSAKAVQEKGYSIGLHMDPLIYFSGWEKAYQKLIQQMAATLDPERIAWVSVGSLRFDKPLKAIATERFPHTAIFSEDFIESPDGKMRYFKTLRIQMFQKVWQWLGEWSDSFPRYLCMEPPWMWDQVTGDKAPLAEEVESRLIHRLKELQKAS